MTCILEIMPEAAMVGLIAQTCGIGRMVGSGSAPFSNAPPPSQHQHAGSGGNATSGSGQQRVESVDMLAFMRMSCQCTCILPCGTVSGE